MFVAAISTLSNDIVKVLVGRFHESLCFSELNRNNCESIFGNGYVLSNMYYSGTNEKLIRFARLSFPLAIYRSYGIP